MTDALILVGSPRVGGNSDFAAELIRNALSSSSSVPQIIRLADLRISPCRSCGFCTSHPGHCAIADDAPPLYSALFSASLVLLVAPIYFYHLPAQVKAWMDRAQYLWKLKERGMSDKESHNVAALPASHKEEKKIMGEEIDFSCLSSQNSISKEFGKAMLPTAKKSKNFGVVLLAGRSQGKRLFEGALLSLRCFSHSLELNMFPPLCLMGIDKPRDLAGNDAMCRSIRDYAIFCETSGSPDRR